jgi:hypothetical protein
VDGSATKNLNKTGVRLWTDPSFNQNGDVGASDAASPALAVASFRRSTSVGV